MNFLARWCAPWGALVGLALAIGSAGAQLPTTADPHPLLPIALGPKKVFGKTLEDVRDTAMASVLKIEGGLAGAQARIDEGKTNEVTVGYLEALYAEILLLERAGIQLDACGELAGKDITGRTSTYKARLTQLAERRLNDRNFHKQVANRLKPLDNEVPLAVQKFPAIRKQLEKRPEDAQKLFWNAQDKIEQRSLWYGLQGLPSRHPSLKSFDDLRTEILAALKKQWVKESLDWCDKALADARSKADYARLVKDIEGLTVDLGRAATVKMGDQTLSGPEAVSALGVRWQQLDKATFAARGWAWQRTRVGGGDQSGSELAETQQREGAKVASALAKLIAADAARVTPQEAPELYERYVTALLPLVLLSPDQGFVESFRAPLDQLAARSPDLKAEVLAYHHATDELLRWRRRMAQACAVARRSKAPPIDHVARNTAPQVRDLLGPLMQDQGKLVAQLTGPIPAMIQRLAALSGKLASAADLAVEVPGAADLSAVSNYERPIRCTVKLPPKASPGAEAWQKAVALLRSELALGPGKPPLTLEGRAALKAAEQGDLMSAGGPILRRALRSWGEYFIRLPDDRRGRVRLTPMPRGEPVGPNELVVLVEIDSRWMEGRHYFVDVPAK